MLDRFEADMRAYTGIAYAVAVASGTAAMHLALREIGVGPGDEVWTTSMTFIGGVSPITFLGATPVFVDIAEDSWTIDISLIEEALASARRESRLPKAIIPTDLYGQPVDIERLNAVAAVYGVPVVADSAEAIGAFINGRHAGAGARAAIFSFNGNKIITSSAGGMLMSDDKHLIDRARHLSTQARESASHYEHLEIGYNYRMSNVCAAIGVGQLEMIEQKVERRREIFARYNAALGQLPGVSFMPEAAGARSTRWLTCLALQTGTARSDRIALQRALDAADIEARPLWKPMHMQPVFSNTRFIGSGVCCRLFDTGLCLPSGSGMSDAEQDRVIDVVSRVLDGIG